MVAISVLLGKRIKEIRESKNIKQVELANMIDVDPTNLSKIEKGIHFPKDETINKILVALNTDVNNLFSFEHLKTKEELIKSINNTLNVASEEDLQFFHRFITAYKESQRNKNL
jgi:transcriptional regulator with XRE-family HTH domain